MKVLRILQINWRYFLNVWKLTSLLRQVWDSNTLCNLHNLHLRENSDVRNIIGTATSTALSFSIPSNKWVSVTALTGKSWKPVKNNHWNYWKKKKWKHHVIIFRGKFSCVLLIILSFIIIVQVNITRGGVGYSYWIAIWFQVLKRKLKG